MAAQTADPFTPPTARRWEAEELYAALHLTGRPLAHYAATVHRSVWAFYLAKRILRRAQQQRLECGAFLPDDGLPYRARMARIHCEASAS